MALTAATFKRDPRFVWFWRILSPLVAGYMFINARLTTGTSVVSVCGPGANYVGAAIYVNWHKYLPFLCIHHGQHRRCMLMSSAPYMEPIAQWCRWLGMTVIQGAPGERSRNSMVHLADLLKCGRSVVLAVDGPAGPAFQVKPGCVELARAAAAPIIPVSYRSKKGKPNLKRWDQIYTVGKFDWIEVRYGELIKPGLGETEAAVLDRVQKGLEQLANQRL